jgi:hypothetical protein
MKEGKGPLMLLAHTNNDAQDYYKLGATFAIQQDFIAAKVTSQLLSYELGHARVRARALSRSRSLSLKSTFLHSACRVQEDFSTTW